MKVLIGLGISLLCMSSYADPYKAHWSASFSAPSPVHPQGAEGFPNADPAQSFRAPQRKSAAQQQPPKKDILIGGLTDEVPQAPNVTGGQNDELPPEPNFTGGQNDETSSQADKFTSGQY